LSNDNFRQRDAFVSFEHILAIFLKALLDLCSCQTIVGICLQLADDIVKGETMGGLGERLLCNVSRALRAWAFWGFLRHLADDGSAGMSLVE
jgi:hypothetical protein